MFNYICSNNTIFNYTQLHVKKGSILRYYLKYANESYAFFLTPNE